MSLFKVVFWPGSMVFVSQALYWQSIINVYSRFRKGKNYWIEKACSNGMGVSRLRVIMVN